jgi:phage shock protein E
MKMKIMMKRLFTLSLAMVIAFFTLQACGQSREDSKSEQTRITAEQFQKQVSKNPGIVIDVRTQEEYDAGHLAMTDRHHDLLNGDFEAQLSSLDKDSTYYLYCRSGNRSGQALELMKENGFEQVYNIGGYQDLVNAGLESSK